MKRILFTITVFAVCYVTNVNASISDNTSTSLITTGLTKGGLKGHPEFSDAELRSVLKDIANQLDTSYEEVRSMYQRDMILLTRISATTYAANVLDAEGGLGIDLIGEIL